MNANVFHSSDSLAEIKQNHSDKWIQSRKILLSKKPCFWRQDLFYFYSQRLLPFL